MSCNRCATASDAFASVAGVGDVEAKWADNRDHPQFCGKCHAFLRADGGCSRCDATGVPSDGDTLALAATAAAPRMHLSCNHTKATVVSPGDRDWCTECDDWVSVDTPYGDTTLPATILHRPPDDWGPARLQLWGILEQEAQRLGITRVVRRWEGFADSPESSVAKGKVDGFFYGQNAAGEWYFVTATGGRLE